MNPQLDYKLFEQTNSAEHASFLKDCDDLFSGLVPGNMRQWGYASAQDYTDVTAGAYLWSQLVENATSYYICKLGDQALTENLFELISYVGQSDCAVVDLGPGHLQPDKLNLFKGLARYGAYVPVDLSQDFLLDLIDLRRMNVVPEVYPIIANFMSDTLEIPFSNRRIFTLFGVTIGNLIGGANTNPEREVIRFLTQLKRHMRPHDTLIIDFDSCQNGDAVLECYNDPYSIPVMLAPLYKIARDLDIEGNFDPAEFRAEFEWFGDVGQCAHTAIATQEHRFVCNSKFYNLPEGTRLHLSNSYKFSTEQMQHYFTKAGFGNVQIFGSNLNPMKLAVGTIA